MQQMNLKLFKAHIDWCFTQPPPNRAGLPEKKIHFVPNEALAKVPISLLLYNWRQVSSIEHKLTKEIMVQNQVF